MVTIRSANEIILSLIDYFRIAQPDLDTKPGTVSRDLFIESPATVASLLYDELGKISNLQSMRVVVGADLDKLAQNFGATRRTSVKSTGLALLTFSSIPATVAINKGNLISATNGATFAILNGVNVNPALSNQYRSVAAKFRNDLDFLGITDQYAVEVSVEATTPGAAGNISKYSLNRTTIPGVSNVTNVFSFSGGANQEDDASFRNRVLSIFSGSSVGTNLGYRNTALSDSGVQDAIVVEPGDPLMTRDGSVVKENADGSFTVISEGTGGKIDIVLLGSRLSEYVDSFIYRDKSNLNDPTNEKNNFVLGQIAGDSNKTITRRRIDNIAAGILPAQPVEEIVQVTGSLSGSNFVEKNIDSLGRVTGNYELLKDTGVYKGSPFGFDTFKWVSNQVSFNEDRVRARFNGQDAVTFTDLIDIPVCQQNITITNENSTISSSDRSIITLLHTPATNVTRVFNVNTGERYIISDQNPDSDTNINSTGRVFISGNTLPSPSDVLEVDYTWIVDYDPFNDYDGRYLDNNIRSVTDSIDWGYSNKIKETVTLTKNSSSTFWSANTTHPIASIVNINTFSEAPATAVLETLGVNAGKLALKLEGLPSPVDNIDSIKLYSTQQEVYNTASGDGSFTNERVVISSQIKYNCTIIFPSDTRAIVGNICSVVYNLTDIFNVNNSLGNFSLNQVTVPISNITTTANSILCTISYIADIQNLFSVGVASLPLSKFGNGFSLNSNVLSDFSSYSNILNKENQLIQQDSDGYFFVKLNLSSVDNSLDAANIISIIRLSDNQELWNSSNLGTISIDTSDNRYRVNLSGFNSPVLNQSTVIIYSSEDLNKTQPFTFSTTIIDKNITSLNFNATRNQLFVNIKDINPQINVNFEIIDTNTDLVYASATDGLLTVSSNESIANLSSSAVDFSTIDNILSKKIRIYDSVFPNNNAIYNITSYDNLTDTVTISVVLNSIEPNQVSIIRLADNKELWSSTGGTIDSVNNIIYLPTGVQAAFNDSVLVLYYQSINLKQAPTRLAINTLDQINNTGLLTVSGLTLTKAQDVIFTPNTTSLKQNVIDAIRTSQNLASTSSLNPNLFLARVVKLEVVETSGNEVIRVKSTLDVNQTKINNNFLFMNEMYSDTSLGPLDFEIPSTSANANEDGELNILSSDKLRITFYYATPNDSESIFFTRNGTIYTNKYFALIDRIFVSSGFTASASTKITSSFFNQPASGSRYKAFYNYIAPKQNERIVINYNYNKLVTDVTFTVENSRPINADVIVRASDKLLVDVTMNVVILPEYSGSETTVLQNLKDRLVSAINTGILNDTLDASDLVNTAYSVSGVDRARITFFNKNGNTGQVLSLSAQKDEYFSANNVIVQQETR